MVGIGEVFTLLSRRGRWAGPAPWRGRDTVSGREIRRPQIFAQGAEIQTHSNLRSRLKSLRPAWRSEPRTSRWAARSSHPIRVGPLRSSRRPRVSP